MQKPWWDAVAFGSAAVTYELLRAGVHPNTKVPGFEHAIVYAVQAGHLADVRHLASFGAALDVRDGQENTLMSLAIKRRDPAMALLLLALGGTEQRDGALVAAACDENKLDLALALVAHGSLLDEGAKGSEAWQQFVTAYAPLQKAGIAASDSPLHMAARLGAPGYVLESIAVHQENDINALNAHGQSALHLARNSEAVRALLARNAELSVPQGRFDIFRDVGGAHPACGGSAAELAGQRRSIGRRRLDGGDAARRHAAGLG